MKKLQIWAMVFVLAALLSVPLMAQPRPAEGQGQGRGGDWMNMEKEAADKLGITPDQQDKLKTVKDQVMEKMKAVWKDQAGLMKQLRELVEKKASDAELSAVLNKLEANKKATQQARLDAMDQARSILTPLQQAKYTLWKAKQMGQRMGEMKEQRGKGKDKGKDQKKEDKDENEKD